MKGPDGGLIIRGGGVEYRSIVTEQFDGETEIEAFFLLLPIPKGR